MRRAFLVLIVAWGSLGQTSPPLPSYARLEANIPYDQHPQTMLDIVSPSGPAKERRPAVIAIHGGGWEQGSKEAFTEQVLPWVEKGFVAANVDYRLLGVALAPAAAVDVLKAVEWFRKNGKRWNVDTGRIVLMGRSAGGYLALIAGLGNKNSGIGSHHDMAAIVNFWGLTDMEDAITGPNPNPQALKWFPAEEQRGNLARRLSPMVYVRKDVPPVLTVHGSDDETVPYMHAVKLTKALRQAGADAEMISVPGGKHPVSDELMKPVYPQIWEFLRRRGILK
ncbi:MAG TPA: alpha/beta hydrolase [Bryobacteraceae bacterium]|nr:alpha/beta hydrolase [Bryobacteraceae bacterium]